jgi:hypothetical protein
MGVAVRLSRPVVVVLFSKGSKLFEPFVDVLDEAVFGVIYIDTGSDVHGRNEDHSFLNAAFGQRRLDLGRDVYVFPVVFSPEIQVLRVKVHNADDTVWCNAALL